MGGGESFGLGLAIAPRRPANPTMKKPSLPTPDDNEQVCYFTKRCPTCGEVTLRANPAEQTTRRKLVAAHYRSVNGGRILRPGEFTYGDYEVDGIRVALYVRWCPETAGLRAQSHRLAKALEEAGK